MKASEYFQTLSLVPKESEEDCLQELIESHKRIRDSELRRGEHWRRLPNWKKIIVLALGVNLWP